MQADSIRKISLLHNLNLRLFISFTKFCHSQGVKHSRQVYENSKGIEKTSLPCTIINTVAMHLKKSVLFIYMQFPIINIHTLSMGQLFIKQISELFPTYICRYSFTNLVIPQACCYIFMVEGGTLL